MSFASQLSESSRLLIVALAMLILELLLIPRIVFLLMMVSAQWSSGWHLLILAVPRFLSILALVLIFGPFRRQPAIGAFLLAYGILLVIAFHRAENFVDWSNPLAVSRATVPYAAGLIGAVLAFWCGNKLDAGRQGQVRAPVRGG